MVEQQPNFDSVVSPSDTLSEGAPSLSDCTRSSTSSYPDLAPYSAVTSFTLPAQCDPDLLTPISTADSPPLLHGHKMMSEYPAPDSPTGQGPTPPGSSRMYNHWTNSPFEINGHHSESSSPMHTPSHPGNEYYITGRRTPIPPEPYLGVYGVSDSSHPAPVTQNESPYYLHQMPDHNPLVLRSGHTMSMEPQTRELSRDISMSAPMLHDVPRVSFYRHPSARRSSHDVPIKQERRGSEAPIPCPRSSPRRRSEVIGNHRVKKSSTKKKTRKHLHAQMVEEHVNCVGEEVPPVIKDTCPDEERCIFDSRWRHRNKRGMDMWESIQSDFHKQFNRSHGKEMLQMKFRRARSKYIQWLPKDEEILREAWKKVEQNRYQAILDVFLEMGGSRNMRLNSTDIEVKLVNDMKIEEQLYLDCFRDMDIRRRRKISAKKRPNGRGEHEAVFIAEGMIAMDPRDVLTEDEVIDQVHEARESSSRWGSPVNHAEMMDIPMWDSRAPMKIEPGTTPQMLGGAY